MIFITDKQTLDDLKIFGRHGEDSIYSLYNNCATTGGAAVMEYMFRYPLNDEEAINHRSDIIKFFSSTGFPYPYEVGVFDIVKIYMDNKDTRTKLSPEDDSVGKKITNALVKDNMTAQIKNGIAGIAEILRVTKHFVSTMQLEAGNKFQDELTEIRGILMQPVFVSLLETQGKLSFAEVIKFDELLRFRNRETVNSLLDFLYHLDVYIAVGRIARERRFNFPKALPKDENSIRIKGLYHPQVENAVANDIRITSDGNVIFLTGANMAGKSTFMKSLSIALYLAHMGFPVAGSEMEFAVLDGIYTTINLPDDLGMGVSHFYAEVIRVKKVSQELKKRRLFIVFDEMFRGTNVKDAAEATIAFTEAFARNVNSMFVISTHIVEAGDVLKERCPNIRFVFLPTVMNGKLPVYTYKIKEGITEDRHGMIIINNERILEILNGGNPGKSAIAGTRTENFFIADQQTLQDLNLLGKYRPNSIYSLFNQVKTGGGERLLEQMFHQPLTDADQINERSMLFEFFTDLDLPFPIEKEVFTRAEAYLSSTTSASYQISVALLLFKKVQQSLIKDPGFSAIYAGLISTIELLNVCHDFIVQLNEQDKNPYRNDLRKLLTIFKDPRLGWISAERHVTDLPLMKVAAYDYLLKHTLRHQMETLLECLYRLDVFISVGQVAKARGLFFASALGKDSNLLETKALWHPSLINGTTNPVSFNQAENMIFLTGANMAGKSTLMKALGIAVYLAHMGFPVAAKEMRFSVREGLYSSINVHDDLNLGYSHFYAEVLRVKTVADAVSTGKNLVVLFDELFKGTNVKDAYDGTLSVTAAFGRYRKCFYVVSTHIIEVGEALRQKEENIQFAYLPTVMDGKIPRYTYQLREGITSDRQGMMIIENERILEML